MMKKYIVVPYSYDIDHPTLQLLWPEANHPTVGWCSDLYYSDSLPTSKLWIGIKKLFIGAKRWFKASRDSSLFGWFITHSDPILCSEISTFRFEITAELGSLLNNPRYVEKVIEKSRKQVNQQQMADFRDWRELQYDLDFKIDYAIYLDEEQFDTIDPPSMPGSKLKGNE